MDDPSELSRIEHYMYLRMAALLLIMLLTQAGTVHAQPPVAPDQKPVSISMEDLTRSLDGPSLIGFNLSNVSATTLFNTIAQSGGVALDPYETSALLKSLPTQSHAFKNDPFLQVLRTCCKECGLYFEFVKTTSNSTSGLTLRLRKADNAAYSMDGPTLGNGLFQVFITQTHRNRLESLRLADTPPLSKITIHEELIVDFVIFADPKVLQQGMVGSWQFTDSDGWKIRSVDKEGIWTERARNHASLLEWRFTATKVIKPGDALKAVPLQLTGLGPLVVTKTERWEIDNLTSPSSKESQLKEGLRQHKLLDVKHLPNRRASNSGETYVVQFCVEGVGISKGRWSNWPLMNGSDLVTPFRLLDADGHDFGLKSVQYNNNIVVAEFNSRFRRGAAPLPTGPAVKIVWHIPTEIRTAALNLKFKDISVP